MKDRKVKEIEETELHLRIKTDEFVDDYGRTIIKSEWIKANGEVSLGSMAKPNKKVLEIKYNVPNDKPLFKRLMGE